MLALMMAAALAGDPDGVVQTARPDVVVTAGAVAPTAPSVQAQPLPTDPHGLTTDQQIDRWLAARTQTAPFENETTERPERRMHGEVSVGIGTGGYNQVGGWVEIPIGESGAVSLSFDRRESDRELWPSYDGWAYGHGGYGDAPLHGPSATPFGGARGDFQLDRPSQSQRERSLLDRETIRRTDFR